MWPIPAKLINNKMKKKFKKIISKYKSVDFVIKDEFKYYYSDVTKMLETAYKLGKKEGEKKIGRAHV